MTLVEIVITVAILAMALGIVATSVGQVARLDLRHGARLLVQHIRRTYDDAVITGQQHRLRLTLRQGQVVVESTTDTLRFDSRIGAFATAQQSAQAMADGKERAGPADLAAFGLVIDPKLMAKAEGQGGGGPLGLLGTLGQISGLGSGTEAAGFREVSRFQLPKGIVLRSVWTSGLTDLLMEGEASLLFFPGGYTQQALLHLEDGDKRIMTVEVAGLTGRCRVIEGDVEIPK